MATILSNSFYKKPYIMKLSKFTHLFSREGRYFLYSALSNAFAELNENLYNYLYHEKHFTNIQVNESDRAQVKENYTPNPEEVQILREMKAIEVDDDYEIERIRFSYYASRFNPRILSLTINPTLACNFRCKYCFEKDHRNEYMTEAIEESIATFVKNNTFSKMLSVTWFGGEPLLAYNTMQRLTSKLINLKTEYDAGIITNGYLLNRNVCRGLVEMKISRMQITIDGNELTHNSRRFLSNGGGTFKQIINNIDIAQTETPEIRICIRVNVDTSNSYQFVEVYEYFKNKQYPNLDVTPGYVVDLKESGTNSFCMMDDAKVSQFLMELAEQHGIYNGDFYPHGRGGICGACKPSSVVIGPRGELYRCWNDVGCRDREYGSIEDGITNHKVLYEYLGAEDQFADRKCLECILLPVCSGGCPYHRIMSRKKGTEYSACPLIKSDLDNYLWMHYCQKVKQNQ